MNLTSLTNRFEKILRDNSHTILTSLGISGTLTTAYLAAKASFRASYVINKEQDRLDRQEKSHPLDNKEKARLVWKFYIPTAVSAGLTMGCTFGGAKLGSKKTAAAYSLLTVSEKAFTEYKEKVVEQLGEKKEQAIRDQIAQDRVAKTASSSEVVIVGSGNVLCYEMHTGRYFDSDIETLRRATNEINAKMVRETEATLSDFYYLIGLTNTQYSDRTGWSSCKLLELKFSTVMSADQRPCIAFEYNYIEPF